MGTKAGTAEKVINKKISNSLYLMGDSIFFLAETRGFEPPIHVLAQMLP